MAASTSSSPITYRKTTNPTTTQHDWRFPRRTGQPHTQRYAQDNSDAAAPPNSTSSAGRRTNLSDLSLDLSSTYATARDHLLASEPFPALKDDLESEFRSFDDLAEEDPLAIRVWKFYAQTKLRLPDQRRMENLTWRMMHGKLMKRRHEQAQSNNRYVAYSGFPVVHSCDYLPFQYHKSPAAHDAHYFPYRLARAAPVSNGAANGPSGIAQQLRRSEEEQAIDFLDAMNVDDFLFYENGAPSSYNQGHGPDDDMQGLGSSTNASAIPINSRKDPFERLSPQSVPPPRHENEFAYVNRRHRKTSIDERPVSFTFVSVKKKRNKKKEKKRISGVVFCPSFPNLVKYFAVHSPDREKGYQEASCQLLSSCPGGKQRHRQAKRPRPRLGSPPLFSRQRPCQRRSSGGSGGCPLGA